jgi:peptidoglycan/LPS O-acetylase OafA/YrhL
MQVLSADDAFLIKQLPYGSLQEDFVSIVPIIVIGCRRRVRMAMWLSVSVMMVIVMVVVVVM